MIFYSGVPDSELKDNTIEIIASDEGEALAIAVGKFLATGEKQLVYTQPNGFANALDAWTSLCIPYLIGTQIIVSSGNNLPQHKIMSKFSPLFLSYINLYFQ